jgi:hypothetical protein
MLLRKRSKTVAVGLASTAQRSGGADSRPAVTPVAFAADRFDKRLVDVSSLY